MPDWAGEVRARLSSLRLSPTREREIVEELSQHLEDRWRELIAGGASADEATRLTLAQFRGDDVLAKYLAPLRQAHAPSPITPGAPTEHVLAALVQSLRHAARILWKQPGFSGVAVLTLALGIGATTAVYSVVNGVLLKPLPFRDPDRLVTLYHVTPASQKDLQGAATYFTYRDHGQAFEDIGLWQAGSVGVIRGGVPEQVRALRVTDGTLSLLEVRAELGRLIGKDNDVPGAPLVAVLTHTYWEQAFGTSPEVVGRSLVISGEPCEIIGVLPASFKFLNTDPQLVLPLRLNRATTRTGSLGQNGIARLKPGVTLAQANDDIARMIPLLVKQFPLMSGVTQEIWDAVGLTPNVRPLSEAVVGDLSRPLWILLGTVAIILLMAWTNVAGLLLVRAEGRQHELAVRRALGASRGRIAAALLSESLVLGLAGGALGVVFAQAGITLLRWLAPSALPRRNEIGIDAAVLLVTLGISVVTSLLFGLVPVLRSRVFSSELLKESGRGSTTSPGRHRMRNTLVVGQIALAVVLLTVSGLMARTFVTMRQVQPGFARPTEVETFELSLPAALVPDAKQVVPTYEQISARLQQVPGVTAVGLGIITMDGRASKGPIFVEGVAAPTLPPIRFIRQLGEGYFEAMENPIIAGRSITWADIQQRRPLTLISENLALEYWDTPAKAIGHRIRSFADAPWQEIVGVVGNERADGLNHPPPALVYVPMANEQGVSRFMMYVVRSGRAGTATFLHELQHAVWSVNARVPLANVRTLAEIQADSMAPTSFATVMLAIAATVALLLALVGVYGVVSYIVAERTYEVGIRIALGAQSGDVRALFLRHGLALTLAGLALGIGAAMFLTPIMSALLYGVAPTDPVTYAGVATVLGAVTLLATYLPARRASRVQPIIALRSQ
jgi:putative ABC transport system permease protein